MTVLVIAIVWLGVGVLATAVMVPIGRAGHWEDEHRGHGESPADVFQFRPVA